MRLRVLIPAKAHPDLRMGLISGLIGDHLSRSLRYMIVPTTTYIKSDIQPRLDRLPWSRWHVKVVFALGFAWLLDSLETNIIGSILGILKKIWNFTPLQGSLAVSVWLIGIMVGAVA
ncbi:MAG: transporter, partial [Nitrospirae bacterium]|nr:transporter [Nitrospirota bacterium]